MKLLQIKQFFVANDKQLRKKITFDKVKMTSLVQLKFDLTTISPQKKRKKIIIIMKHLTIKQILKLLPIKQIILSSLK
jgi:hypothetical protein